MTRGQKVLLAAGIIFLIWVLSDPPGAADFVGDLIENLKDAANAIIVFLKSVFA